MRKSVGFIFLALLLSSCNEHNSTSNSGTSNSISNSVQSSTSVVLNQNIVKLTNFKNRLLKLKHDVSSCTYTTSQTDNYSALNVEAVESGTKALYSDNFMTNIFSQTIGEETFSGRRELGLINNMIYQINYYGDDDSNNNVKYYEDNETSRQGLFSLDFVTEYVNNILDYTIKYYERNGRYSLKTNFEEVTFPDNGAIKLQYHFIYYSSDGTIKAEEVQREDTLTLSNGYIMSSKTSMMYGIQNSVNYKYMNSETSYKYEELKEYTETKLDPSKF